MQLRYKTLLAAILLALISANTYADPNGSDVVIGKSLKLYSKIIGEERPLLVSVPDDYGKSTESYPVLYVLDGSVKTLIEAKADLQMSKYCYAPDMIIVAIENTVRNRDMLPGTDDAPKFLRFITEELIPFINKEYRTDADQRILYGGSNAGLFTLFTFLDNPDHFAGYIASSPTVCHRKSIMMDKVRELTEKNIPVKKFVYIIWGDIDFPGITDTLAVFIPWLKELEPRGLRLKTEYLPQDGHIPFGSLQYGLMTMYEGYSYPSDKLENENLDSMKAYYRRYSEKAGYQQNPPKQKVLFFGQEKMRQEKYNEAVEAFRYCLDLYPADYQATLLLAVAYFKNHEIERARKEYFAAKEIQNRIKEKNDPPIEEWSALKKEFES